MLETATVGSLKLGTTVGVDPAGSASLLRKEDAPFGTVSPPTGRAALRVPRGESGGVSGSSEAPVRGLPALRHSGALAAATFPTVDCGRYSSRRSYV
jgi:hypothetical protein